MCVLICYVCVLILLCMCPHTAIYVSSYCYMCVLILLMSTYCCICVFILLCMCHHTANVLVLIYMCPHTAICVRVLLHMSPHLSYIYLPLSLYYHKPASALLVYVSSNYYIWGRIPIFYCACVRIIFYMAFSKKYLYKCVPKN